MNFKFTPFLVAAAILLPLSPISAHPHHFHDHDHEHETDNENKSKNKVRIAYKTPNVLPKNEVKIYTKGAYRYIVSNAIPDHPTGQFPNAGNPNSIKAQKLTFKVPANPQDDVRSGDKRSSFRSGNR